MSLYKKILVAIDQTDEADEVIAAADTIAKQNDAELSFLTVVQPVNYAYSGYDGVAGYAAFPAFEAEAQKSANESLKGKAGALGRDGANVAVILGKPSTVIKDHAKGMEADLIVLGSHCRHGLGLLLGSTANGVLHGAPCDVLTIRIAE